MKKKRADGTGCAYARRRKDGSILGWWLKFYRNGEQIVRNAHTTDKDEAKELLARLLGEKAKGVPIPRRQLTLEGAANHVARVATNKTGQDKKNYAYETHLIPFFGRHMKMSAIDAIEIEKYKEHRLGAGAAPATVNRELEALRRAFTLAVQHGLLPSRPHVERLAEDNVRKGFFEPAQFEALLRHLVGVESGKAKPVAHVVTLAYVTGWRLGEVVGLRWRNVDLKAGTVRLEPGTTKNKEGRTFPLNAELRRLLEERREAQKLRTRRARVVALKDGGEGLVFTKKNGAPIVSFRKRWHSAVRRSASRTAS